MTQTFKIKYIIPDNLPDCHASGVWGGISPSGKVHLHFFNERQPIPLSLYLDVDNANQVKEKDVESGGDFIRLVQSSIVMDVSTAVSLRDWLTNKIDIYNKVSKDMIPKTVTRKKA